MDFTLPANLRAGASCGAGMTEPRAFAPFPRHLTEIPVMRSFNDPNTQIASFLSELRHMTVNSLLIFDGRQTQFP
ncbi:hypothetical protein [Rhizobium croatiense]|uniref:Uncharacterized protein n=1 Tax=Rhizobium croatiense TaxID=2867516 RepID=A0ABS7LUX6_9HYPH|nr:hypothetical protein [Rhizobium croatiense]MBY4628653.1 hypothetical protein [Rhizobium croatiense]